MIKKIIPGYVFNDPDNERHITASTLSWKFDIKYQTIRRLVRQGELKARQMDKNGTLVFLAKENPDVLTIVEASRRTSLS